MSAIAPVSMGTMPRPPAAPPAAPAAAPAPGAAERAGRLPAPVFDKALQGALVADPGARYAVDRASNSATFLSGSFEMRGKTGAVLPPDAVATEFLQRHGQLFGSEGAQGLRLVGSEVDDLGFRHFRYQQFHGELPVFGQQLVVHAQGNVVRSVGGRLTPNIELPPMEGHLAASDAARRAIDSLSTPVRPGFAGDDTPAARPGTAGARLAADSDPMLGVYTADDGRPALAWQLEVAAEHGPDRWRVYVDATQGTVLDSWSLLHTAVDRQTHDAAGRTTIPGKLVRKEGEGPVGDPIVDAAHDNAGAVYEYFHEQHGRDGLDGRGGRLTSTVHYGTRYNNAFWNGQQMTYGDGDGVRFGPFATAVDVVGHEMAHGITEKTAGLNYRGQSGALNESWSDVFGNLVEKWAEQRAGQGERDPKWFIGEEIFTPGTGDDGLRSMSAPGTGYAGDPQPAHMRDYKNVSNDNGGVHINSGIPNKAAYEIAKQIGIEKLGKVWYRTLAQYLTPRAQFADAANVSVQAAADLYGKDSAEVRAVRNGWASVGLAPTVRPGVAPQPPADTAPASTTAALAGAATLGR